jgi:hypothetical protein
MGGRDDKKSHKGAKIPMRGNTIKTKFVKFRNISLLEKKQINCEGIKMM